MKLEIIDRKKGNDSVRCLIYLGPAYGGLEPQQRFEFIIKFLVDLIKSLKKKLQKKIDDGEIGTTPPPVDNLKWGWFADSPYDDLQLSDTLVYQGSAAVSAGAGSISVNFTGMGAASYYVVVREPVSQPVRTTWNDSGSIFNNGSIPDSVFLAPFTNGGYRYYVSRNKVYFDTKPASRVVFS